MPEALAAYNKAQNIDPSWKISADDWSKLCWYGTLYGYPNQMMQACDKSLELEPDNGEFRDNRGVARALTGDTQGAIKDFQAFIKSTNVEPWRKQRQGWIDDLKVGKNPFTKEVTERLLRESVGISEN